jgi:hypothetical protein
MESDQIAVDVNAEATARRRGGDSRAEDPARNRAPMGSRTPVQLPAYASI